MSSTTRTDLDMPQRAFSYGRISTGGRQARGSGLKRQQGQLDEQDESWPERVCEEQGWTLDEETFTDKGKSGFHKKNLGPKAALTKFLKYIKSGRVLPGNVLLLDKLDRLSRAEMDDAHDLFRDILRAGVWVCTRLPFRIYRGDQPRSFMDIIEPLWIMYVNYMESLKKSDNAKGAWQLARAEARDKGRPHQAQPPFWLRRTEQGYEPIPELFALVREIHSLTWQHYGARRIVQIMRERGVPFPVRGNRADGSARDWNLTFVQQQVLGTRRVVGEYQPCKREGDKRVPAGEPIPGYYLPAPLTEKEYQRTQGCICQQFRRRGRPSRRNVNLFVGLVREAVTRQRMAIGPSTEGGRYVPYLVVPGRNGLRAAYQPFEEYALAAVAQLRTDDVIEPELRSAEREHEMAELDGRQAALAERQRQLQGWLADPARDPTPWVPVFDQVTEELKRVRRQREVLQQETRSNRGGQLKAAQALVEYRAGVTDPEERRELDERIREALPGVLGEVWVQCQKLTERRQVVHVQLWLRGGASRYFQLLPKNLRPGERIWQLDPSAGGPDLRRGAFEVECGHATAVAQPA